MTRLYYFMTKRDLLAVFSEAESTIDLCYSLDSNIGDMPKQFESTLGIRDLGIPEFNDKGRCNKSRYFIHSSPFKFTYKSTLLAKSSGYSGFMHSLEPENNSGCIVFVNGGIGKGEYIMPGELSSFKKDIASKKLLVQMTKCFKKFCLIQKDVAIGPEALALHEQGYRLCQSLAAIEKYDFVIKKVKNKKVDDK
jgi:hypothetical protein